MEQIVLAELRKKYGFTQKDLAGSIGITSAAIAMYETGKRTPPLKTAIRIANFFNVNVEAIQFSNINE